MWKDGESLSYSVKSAYIVLRKDVKRKLDIRDSVKAHYNEY